MLRLVWVPFSIESFNVSLQMKEQICRRKTKNIYCLLFEFVTALVVITENVIYVRKECLPSLELFSYRMPFSVFCTDWPIFRTLKWFYVCFLFVQRHRVGLGDMINFSLLIIKFTWIYAINVPVLSLHEDVSKKAEAGGCVISLILLLENNVRWHSQHIVSLTLSHVLWYKKDRNIVEFYSFFHKVDHQMDRVQNG